MTQLFYKLQLYDIMSHDIDKFNCRI